MQLRVVDKVGRGPSAPSPERSSMPLKGRSLVSRARRDIVDQFICSQTTSEQMIWSTMSLSPRAMPPSCAVFGSCLY